MLSNQGNILWPASVKLNEAKLIDCVIDEKIPQPAEKFSPYLAKLLMEPSKGQIEGISITFCTDIENISGLSKAELETLRAPLYAMLSKELTAYGVKVNEVFWIIQNMIVEMPLGNVQKLANRPDIIYLDSTNNVAPPP